MMTLEVEQRPKFIVAGYSRHRCQWVNNQHIYCEQLNFVPFRTLIQDLSTGFWGGKNRLASSTTQNI